MKPTRNIVKPNKGLWVAKHTVWFKKNTDYDDSAVELELSDEPTWKTCSRCNGSGNVPHPTKWREGKGVNCPRCKGEGDVKE